MTAERHPPLQRTLRAGLLLAALMRAQAGWAQPPAAAAHQASVPTAPKQPRAADEVLMRQWLRDMVLIDGHNDMPWQLYERFGNHMSRFDLEQGTSKLTPPMHTDLPRMRRGGMGGQFWSVYVPVDLKGPAAVTATMRQIDMVRRLTERYPSSLAMATTAAEVVEAHRSGRIACLIGIEGGHCIDGSLATLRQMHALGARYMTLTHWKNTEWADAATDTPAHHGLTPFGKAVVREMNRLGMLVDLSHVSDEVMRDALDIAQAPAIFSHSSARAICDHVRNVPDDVLRRVRDNGGVVMVNFLEAYVSTEVCQASKRRRDEEKRLEAAHRGRPDKVRQGLAAYDATHPLPKATLRQVADHIDHIRKVAGVDHVGIGGDLDGIETTPLGLPDVSAYPALLAELHARGYSREDLAKVAGANVLRVMRCAEESARRLQARTSPCDATLQELDHRAR